MNPDYTYLITLIDKETDEYDSIVAISQEEMELVLSRKSKNYIVTSVQNIGMTISATEFLEQMTDNEEMNFGSN